ncbi:hypothetical protein DACRYDRAFT_57600 [Dacryopinax primogenitus]|uniref:DNA-directed RNA polymerase III subunit RPC3 n=1 Tax=Dacryopinax primogenitus (strain DJM 731) TaxID=1858805 RepID=M5FRM3_DACPD|nr:uncharacterized protein DACRYDRAFT_57600 [Dacryopinax primogenitus]EJT98368.1 hypothetical protein DACRYDRAFT_57600 [Dacryopinax primogenitus]
MADNPTTHLCVQILQTFFGGPCYEIGRVLLSRGRLPLPLIARLTRLKPRTVRACLIVLIQHNVVWFAESDGEDGEGPRGDTFYEVNVEEVCMRLRFGKFVEIAADVFGDEAKDIVRCILDHGKLRLPAVLDLLEVNAPKSTISHRSTFHALVTSRYLMPTSRLLHTSPKDKIIAWEEIEKRKLKEIPSAKVLRSIRDGVEDRLRTEREGQTTGLKRKPITTGGKGRKKPRRDDEDEEVVDEDVWFRVNYERFNVHLRDTLLATGAAERYNPSFGAVMSALLEAAMSVPNTHPRLSDVRSSPVSTPTLATFLQGGSSFGSNATSRAPLLSAGLKLPSSSTAPTSALKQYLLALSASDNPTPAGQAGAFTSRFAGGGGGEGKVQVEFETIAERMRRRLVEGYVRERWGDGAGRVLGVLWGGTMMDERQIAKISLMQASVVRAALTALQSANFLSLQQVPKTPQREPARSFFLWYCDPQNCYTSLLSTLYGTIANLIERLEREEEVATREVARPWNVARAERSAEREGIKSERERKRDRVWGAVGRADRGVLVLRDLVGGTGWGTGTGLAI